LNRFDNFGGNIAGQGEAGCVGVDFHGAAESLLGGACHTICFIEDDYFVPISWVFGEKQKEISKMELNIHGVVVHEK